MQEFTNTENEKNLLEYGNLMNGLLKNLMEIKLIPLQETSVVI